MANMGYCRFENTLRDLEDCYENMDDNDLSDSETKSRRILIKTCRNIADDYEHELED